MGCLHQGCFTHPGSNCLDYVSCHGRLFQDRVGLIYYALLLSFLVYVKKQYNAKKWVCNVDPISQKRTLNKGIQPHSYSQCFSVFPLFCHKLLSHCKRFVFFFSNFLANKKYFIYETLNFILFWSKSCCFNIILNTD